VSLAPVAFQERIAFLQRDLKDLRRATTHFERITAARKLANETRILERQVIGDARNDDVTWQAIREIHRIGRPGHLPEGAQLPRLQAIDRNLTDSTHAGSGRPTSGGRAYPEGERER
jgi:hypothetical protein